VALRRGDHMLRHCAFDGLLHPSAKLGSVNDMDSLPFCETDWQRHFRCMQPSDNRPT